MSVTAPPRPPRPPRRRDSASRPLHTPRPTDPPERAEPEALIEEARQRARRRRRLYGTAAGLAVLVGLAVATIVEGAAPSRTAPRAVAAGSTTSASAGTSRIAFVRNPSEHFFGEGDVGLYAIRPDGSGEQLLTTVAHHSGGVWSPDGRMLAFSRQGGDEHHGIYVVNGDGSGLTRLTDGADGGPAWSPDGQKIAFVRGEWGNRHGIDRSTEIYVMNVDGTEQRRLTHNQAQDYGPVWSPDGRMLVFGSDRDVDAMSYVMNADGSEQRALLADVGLGASSAAWSPDGKRIIFSSRNSEIYLMNADGSGLRRVTRVGGFSYAWSPDGQEVAFVGTKVGWGSYGVYAAGDAWDLYVMNADGSALRNLNGTPDWEYVPVWSPESRELAFVSFRDGDREIFVVHADGSAMQNVTQSPGTADISPSWSPTTSG